MNIYNGKKALICGVSGQDGSYLAALLLKKGYRVFGTSRDAEASRFNNLIRLGIRDQIETLSMSLIDFRSVLQVLNSVEADEIYNLAGQSSVGLSFNQPVETLESHAIGAINILEVIRFLKKPTKFYNACSSECFGDTGMTPANEDSNFRPGSPYAVAKATAFWEVANYRDAYGLFACSGLLFNHESVLRPARFVTKKIIAAAVRISKGSKERLELGNIHIQRDWGWAPEYVEAMWKMLQIEEPKDYVIASGESYKLESFIAESFQCVGLDWKEYVDVNPALFRPSDQMYSFADPNKAEEDLGWRAQYKMPDVVRMLVQAECVQ